MGWIADTSEAIRAHTRVDPIECPRGWGQVGFVSSVWCVPPLFGVDRKCPIGGVGECDACGHPSNPDAFRLGAQLAELERLRDAGQLSDVESAARRDAIVRLHQGSVKGRRQLLVAAWVIAPLGALITIAGVICAWLVHTGFWGMAGGGLVCLVLGLSFWGLARTNAPRAS